MTDRSIAGQIETLRRENAEQHKKIEARLDVQDAAQKVEAKFRIEIVTGRKWVLRIFWTLGWLVTAGIAAWAALRPHDR